MQGSILFFGDIVGSIGRRAVCGILPEIRRRLSPTLVIANVENLAHGRGITPKTLAELDLAQVDAYTSGNHTWENPNGLVCFNDPRWSERLVRPANILAMRPGHGMTRISFGPRQLFLVNLMGQLFMKDEVESPFTAFDRMYAEICAKEPGQKPLILVDLHTETTSEKEAFGHFVDGRALAVYGTHTHVPTADMKVLPGGTAYVTDVGRNGAQDSVVGFEKKAALSRFLGSPVKAYDIPEHGLAEINAVFLRVDFAQGNVMEFSRVQEKIDV